MRAVSVDFFFDGGSLAIEFEDAKRKISYLKLIIPGSMLRQKLGVSDDEPLLIHSYQGKKSRRVTPQQLQSLTARLMQWEEEPKLHSAITSTLLAIQSGYELKCYGADAVEALETGEWMKLFQDQPSADADKDPFGDSSAVEAEVEEIFGDS